MDELLANLNTDAPMFDAPSVLDPAFDMDPGFMSDTNENSIYPSDLSTSLRNQQSATTPSASTPIPQNMPLTSAEMDYLTVDDAETPAAATAAAAAVAKNPNKQSTAVTPPPVATGKQQDAVAMFAELPSPTAGAAPGVPTPASVPSTSPLPPHSDKEGLAHPTPAPFPSADTVLPEEVPDTPEAIERQRLRPLAAAVVQESWCAGRNPAQFVAEVKLRLPVRRNQEQPQSIVEESSGPRTNAVKENSKLEETEDRNEVLWQLPEPSEGAILDALFLRLVKGSATSTRLMNYLSYSLVTGIVSQRAVIATCLKWITATPDISSRVLQSFARLMAQIVPNYRFSQTDEDLTPEVKEFLGAFTMIIKCTAKTPSLAPELVKVLSHDRVVALVRACARRVPSMWPQIDTAVADLDSAPIESSSNSQQRQQAFAPRSAYQIAPELRKHIPRLKKGLVMGITTFETITKNVNFEVPEPGAPLSKAITAAYETLLSFGREMAKSVRDMWIQREGSRGDYPLLVALERAAVGSQAAQSPVSQKEEFRNKVIACQAIVRFLSERATSHGTGDSWKGLWGGKERLKRIIRDAIPQVKTEIKSESGALLVSVVVVSVAAMILGPSLRIEDANDGVDLNDPVQVSLQETQNEEVEETMGELIGFAVGSLEEAAMSEELPAWRSFGLWLLLLMSRCGSMLRASGCEHVRAARVLRAWGGIPTGTPGSHTAHGSTHKHPSQSGAGHQQAPNSSALSAVTEGVTTFATSASLAIIDASDVSGSDDTIRALCDDLVQ